MKNMIILRILNERVCGLETKLFFIRQNTVKVPFKGCDYDEILFED